MTGGHLGVMARAGLFGSAIPIFSFSSWSVAVVSFLRFGQVGDGHCRGWGRGGVTRSTLMPTRMTRRANSVMCREEPCIGGARKTFRRESAMDHTGATDHAGTSSINARPPKTSIRLPACGRTEHRPA